MTPRISYIEGRLFKLGFWYGVLWAKSGHGDWKLYEIKSAAPVEEEVRIVPRMAAHLLTMAEKDGCDMGSLPEIKTRKAIYD